METTTQNQSVHARLRDEPGPYTEFVLKSQLQDFNPFEQKRREFFGEEYTNENP